MAINFGSAKEKEEAKALLATHHRIDIVVQLMSLSHQYRGELSDRVLSGQVNIDVTADVTRSATLELLDPEHKLNLDANAPTDGSLYFTKMVKIVYVVSTPNFSKSYAIPIFTGPLTKVDRAGPVVSVEAQGKEIMASSAIWSAKTFKKGLKKVEIIRRIMEAAGEAPSKMQFPDRDARISTNVSANRKFTFWNLARKIARGMNLQLFYDGRGVLRLRKIPAKSVYTFLDTKTILSYPQISYDSQEMFNAVQVIGGKPKGSKNAISYRMVAPKNHPMSPWNIGRNGTPRFLPKVIEDSSIKSKSAAKAVAKKELRNGLAQGVEVSFDSLPIPFLEELDLCRYRTEMSAGGFRLQKMSIPLTANGSSSVGYLRRVSPQRANVKNRKGRK